MHPTPLQVEVNKMRELRETPNRVRALRSRAADLRMRAQHAPGAQAVRLRARAFFLDKRAAQLDAHADDIFVRWLNET
jgi:hypothetical protein